MILQWVLNVALAGTGSLILGACLERRIAKLSEKHRAEKDAADLARRLRKEYPDDLDVPAYQRDRGQWS